jgi:UDP-3-O-[3-hydroxymyristoyl] glucosamine N-acyltransferase
MIALSEILQKITYLEFIGNKQEHIGTPKSFDTQNIDPSSLMWVSDKNIHQLKELKIGTVICGNSFKEFKETCNYIICSNPRFTFQEVLANFFIEKEEVGISQTASIHPSVKLGKNISIGNYVTIEKDCVLGDFIKIDHNTAIKHGTVIEDYVAIGCNCTIGGVGFGYELNAEKKYVVMPHIGNVVLKKYVEIGSNTCIDRAVLGSTILDENVKVDNLVHIAHGVTIGENSLIIANSMIAGSTKIGKNVWVAPSASILNKKTVEDNSYIGMGAVVIKDVKESETIVGNPGKVLNKSENKS